MNIESFDSLSTNNSIKYSRYGRIKIKKITKQKIYLRGIMISLLIISLYTLVTLKSSDIDLIKGIDDFKRNIVNMFFRARLSDRYTYLEVLNSLFITLSMAVITTLFGSVLALIISFFASRNLSSENLTKIIKISMSFVRAVPTILWVMIFSIVANIGVEAAVIGMVFHSVAYLVKAYSESIEEVEKGTIEAIKSTGATWWQVIFQAILPSSMVSILSWTFVRFEINFTNAVVVGAAVGSGGIGYELFMAGNMYYDIREIGFFTYLILIVAVTLEMLSYKLRSKYLNKY